ncbi:MAG: UDP-N-acetylglucosamine 2-epimerase (non-hydrolyzing) [Candidatus Methanomethylicia archaeon]|jgi:UDP-N-acetylglucosamine 2-epimerase (non-hydrolysing)|nr:UDP-N-acetylglucosamine 2-epimerase (non-hydrolyzing) [Candidatus Methanomethylicia archaeon]
MKVVSIVGARPNFIKLGPIAKELSHKKIDHVIIHTGQHYDYEMSKIFFDELKIPDPNYNLGVGSDNQAKQLGSIIRECSILAKEEPDVVLVYGDTNSTLGGALAAVKNMVPVAHVEAGLRCYNRKMQEEINRVLTDHLSDFLFCPTEVAMRNLEREGLKERAFLSGDIMVETLNSYIPYLNDNIVNELGLIKKEYILLTLHRAENVDNKERLEAIITSINEVSKYEVIVFPIHPRTKKNIELFGFASNLINENIKLIRPLGYRDFLSLEKNAKLIMTDSGGVQKEAYLLGVPCITLREETEWAETVNCGWNILVGTNRELLVLATKTFRPNHPRPNLFGDGTASKRIVEILRREFES